MIKRILNVLLFPLFIAWLLMLIFLSPIFYPIYYIITGGDFDDWNDFFDSNINFWYRYR